jgi:hypothetical protein
MRSGGWLPKAAHRVSRGNLCDRRSPPHWKELSQRVRFDRAGGRCEACRSHAKLIRSLPDGGDLFLGPYPALIAALTSSRKPGCHGHPAAVDGSIGLDALGAYPQLALSSTGEETAFVDAELARHGLARRIALRAPLLAARPRWRSRT